MAVFADVFEADRDLFRDTGLLHGHAVERVGGRHGFFRMRNDDKLRPGEEALQHFGEAVDVDFVQRGVDFVEHAEGAGAASEYGQKQGHAGQGFLAAA